MQQMKKIEQITLAIKRQKKGIQVLAATDVTGEKAENRFDFSGEGVQATFTLEETDGILLGRIALRLKTESCRENDTLDGLSPISIGLHFTDLPARMTAMYLHRDWWSRPRFIHTFAEMPAQTQCLYLDYGTEKGCFLPLVGERLKAVAGPGSPEVLSLQMTAGMGGLTEVVEPVFLLVREPDIYRTIHRALSAAAGLRGIPVKERRTYPEVFEYLGWCSWDAFYTDISEAKVRAKAQELADKEIPARWFLLDDGWLSVKGQELDDLRPEKEKFPDGFTQLVADLKGTGWVRWVGVWHALGGYWGGIAPDSKAARQCRDYLYQTPGGKLLPAPDGARGYGFYRTWYELLGRQGIDFVKVDGQSAIKNYYENIMPLGQAAKEIHAALEGAAAAYMQGRLINCMGMAMEDIMSRAGSAISRNSDDFIPDKPESFTEHLLQNCYNALYHDELYYCDWDMFWSGDAGTAESPAPADGEKHRILRAVSGGPIYISDPIGESVKARIMPLVYDDGRILRMDRAARPTADCIFTDPEAGGLLKITNIADCGGGDKGGALVVGNISGQESQSTISTADFPELTGTDYYLYHYQAGQGKPFSDGAAETLTLAAGDFSLYLVTPISERVSVLGLLDKYISFHGIAEIFREDKRVTVLLRQGGQFGFYSERPVVSLRVGGVECIEKMTAAAGLCQVGISGRGKQLVTITLG